jgi:hypothetical protein
MQICAWCPTQMDEDDQVLVTEGGDVLCEPDGVGCGSTFKANFPDEVAYIRKLKDVHPDWRV